MAAMKRAAAVFALAATVIIAVWVGAAVSAQRTRTAPARYEWPMGLGTLDDVPKRYPARETSNDAARLMTLAAAAGVDLSPPTGRAATARRTALSEWLDRQLTRADERVDPPPPELAEHEAALADIRAYLLGRAAIIWPTDVVAAAQAPLPNLSGHFMLTRLLIAHALTSPATASDDLCAAWRLQRVLWHRPELISKMVALAGTRMVNAAVRHLDARPPWLDEIRAIDYRRSLLAAQQSEAWGVRKQVEDEGRQSDGRLLDVVLQPYDELCAANFAAVARRASGELAQSRDCAVDGAALDHHVRAMLPFWNRPMRSAMPNLGSIWQRAARFQAELEATERIFAIKSGRWTPDLERSACADGSWIYADGTLRFSREVAAPRPMLNVPLTWSALTRPSATLSRAAGEGR
jgi:hypothetical protein